MAGDDDEYLHDVWTYYFHDPEDASWTLESYKRLGGVSTVRDFWAMQGAVAPFLADGMFFVMREHVYPCWDDPGNIRGGCMSLKVPSAQLEATWAYVLQRMLGERLVRVGRLVGQLRDGEGAPTPDDLALIVNGASVSPKRAFSIIKLWLRTDHVRTREYLRLPPAYTAEVLYKSNADNIKDDNTRQLLRHAAGGGANAR